jgi:hypothetical protein
MIRTCPNCESENIVWVEYYGTDPKHYDGVSEMNCKDCDKRFGRWCGQELEAGESENVFCSGESHE